MDSGFIVSLDSDTCICFIVCDAFTPSTNLTLSNMQGFRRVPPMLCGFLVFATCKAMAYDANTAALLDRQYIPVWSSFVFSDWTVLNQKRTGFCLSYLDEHLLCVVLKKQVSWYCLKMFSCTQHTKEFEDHPQ